jgi:cellulose synthase/poly-beta-1,6-N-acetylglucosamine synthase-like glycosyltransferase
VTKWTVLVAAGSGLAIAASAHTALNARLLRRPRRVGPAVQIEAAILLPARNEATCIADGLRSLLTQDLTPPPSIVVLDDGSDDGTADLAGEVAAGDPRVRVLRGDPVPPGWLGKPHACWQLAAAAPSTAEVLVFVDADVRLAPHAVRSAVELLETHGLDFVSPYPRQLAGGPAERLVQPLLQWSWLTFLPLRLAEHARRPSLAVANGQFLVVRRAAYDRAGGHASVPNTVLEDVALARALRRHGARGGIVDGTELASCRMYESWAQLRDGYGKSLWTAFGSPPGAAAALGLLGLMYLLPPAAMLRGSRLGALGYLAAVAGRVLAARRCGARTWPDPLAHPLSIALVIQLTLRSLRAHRRGELHWKGRSLAVSR